MARRKKKARRFDAKGGSSIAEVISYSAACRARGLRRRWGRRKSASATAVFVRGCRGDRWKHYGSGLRPRVERRARRAHFRIDRPLLEAAVESRGRLPGDLPQGRGFELEAGHRPLV